MFVQNSLQFLHSVQHHTLSLNFRLRLEVQDGRQHSVGLSPLCLLPLPLQSHDILHGRTVLLDCLYWVTMLHLLRTLRAPEDQYRMQDIQLSGTSLKVDENPADVSIAMLWSSSGRRKPEHHAQNVGRIIIHLQAGTRELCIPHASAS